jgi:hypothetical protein
VRLEGGRLNLLSPVQRLVETPLASGAVLLAIHASAPQLVELPMDPPMEISARLGLVTLARRTKPETLGVVRELMARLLRDEPVRSKPC